VDLLLGADDQVALADDGLEVRTDPVGGDEALLAEPRPGEPPEHRPVVDVEHDARPCRTRVAHRSAAGVIGLARREMGPRDEERPRRGDKRAIEVLGCDRHVGAVVAIEEQREGRPVPDREEHESAVRRPGSVTTWPTSTPSASVSAERPLRFVPTR
jgi:hypothetical protein